MLLRPANNISAKRPNIVMDTRLTSNFAKVKNGYVYGGGAYSLSIKKRGEDKDYWKALINTENEAEVYNEELSKTINNIPEKLKKDKM
jgi:hypothetical protein